MGKDTKNRKPLGFWGDFGVGCALDVILMVGFAIIVMDAERVGHALGYALGLSIVVWGVRWLLNQFDLLDGWCGRLIGPVVLVGAMLLAVMAFFFLGFFPDVLAFILPSRLPAGCFTDFPRLSDLRPCDAFRLRLSAETFRLLPDAPVRLF